MKKIIFLFKAPEKCYLAFSGGIDSVVLLHLLLRKGVDVTLVTIDHLTEFSQQEIELCKETARNNKIPYIVRSIKRHQSTSSLESYWSRERNTIFQSLADKPVLTAHHLDDSVEWYIMTSMQGCGRVISCYNKNVQRPLLNTTKEQIIEYANIHKLKYLTDPTNGDSNFGLRNKVRTELVPHIKLCFPGINKVVRKKILEDLNK